MLMAVDRMVDWFYDGYASISFLRFTGNTVVLVWVALQPEIYVIFYGYPQFVEA